MNRILILTIVGICMHSASCKPQSTPIPIVSQIESSDGAGNYAYSFETGNGIRESAQGQLKQIQVPQFDQTGRAIGQDVAQAVVRSGKVSYTSPEGIPIELTYIADENGFQPQGSHLPVPPVPLQ